MADALQHSTESMLHGSLAMDSGWEGTVRPDERSPIQGFEAKATCPICLRADGLLQIGGVIFCAACGYASDGAGGCT